MPGLRHRPQNDLHPSPISNLKSSLSLFLSLSLHSSFHHASPFLSSWIFSNPSRIVRVFRHLFHRKPSSSFTPPRHRFIFFHSRCFTTLRICCKLFFSLFFVSLFFFFSFELLVPILFLLSVSDFVRTVVARYERHRERRGWCSRAAAADSRE